MYRGQQSPRYGSLAMWLDEIHAVVDTNGLPVHLALTPGEAHDNRLGSVLLSALLPQTMVLADRGYGADWIREIARQQGTSHGVYPVPPHGQIQATGEPISVMRS